MSQLRSLLIAILALWVSDLAAQDLVNFRELPKEVRDLVVEVRNSCRDLNPTMTFNDMQGVQILDLNGDGSRDLVIDNEAVCGEHMAGANCSNRGCDMIIYKEIGRSQWRRIFKEHLYAKFLAINWDTMRFQLMVASIFAGDAWCEPAPRKEYTSGQTCNLLVTFHNNRWNWQRIK